jgi:hypothetical protein
MWRSGGVMDMGTLATDIVDTDIQDTDIVDTDIVDTDIVDTMDILMGVITGEGTIIQTTGLITEAIMATHMVAITAGAEDSGSATATKFKNGRRTRTEARGSGGVNNVSPLPLNFYTNVALVYIQCR